MSDLVRFRLSSGRDVLVEADSVDEGLVPAGLGDDGIVTATVRFSEHLDVIRDAVTEALTTLKEDLKPDDITVSFGIRFTAAAGAVIARASLEGTLGVEMSWHKES